MTNLQGLTPPAGLGSDKFALALLMLNLYNDRDERIIQTPPFATNR